MAPGIPNEASGLGWSKYAPSVQNDGLSKGGLNKRTAESIARQAEIDARLSKLRSRRDPMTEQRDEARRLELIASQKAAEDEHARKKAERVKLEKEEQERIKRQKEEEERLQREKEEAERLRREKEEAERFQREKEEAERRQREKEEAERLQREKEEAERLQREREEAERIKREKEEAEEAARRAALYERIDQVEEDGLSKIQAMQLELQKSIEESTMRQQQISNDMNAKKSEIDEVQETLKRVQLEFQDLQDAEVSITAKLEADTRECDELQTASEQIIERASTLRKEVEEKTLKSLDEIEAFKLPGNIEQQTAPAFKDDKPTPPDDQSSTDSSSEPDGSSQEQASPQHNGDKTKHDKTGNGGVSQGDVVQSKPNIVENGKVKNIMSTEPVSTHRKANSNQSLENKFKFEEWPSQEARPFGGAQKRLVKLYNLPISSTVASIQAFVWGGRIEKIEYTPGNTYAWILFMRGQDCEKYYSDTANGIEHPDGNRTIWVELGEAVSVNETLRGFYDAGHTRCVRAVGADEDWGETALVKLASAKKRKLERIVNGANPKGLRVIEFRFTNIVDAGRFKVELQNDIDWEHCNIYFGTDPCETNTGVHLGVQ
ncbi:hypothetical protein BFW01_g8810 [Lasiodiplodia theobromae]|nr:hypothetical protein BFW01_g8810 [Lasiodiplodia theobromae]